MGESDIQLVAIVIIFAVTYCIFLALNASTYSGYCGVCPKIADSGDIIINNNIIVTPTPLQDTIRKVVNINSDNQDVITINSLVFGFVIFILSYVGFMFVALIAFAIGLKLWAILLIVVIILVAYDIQTRLNKRRLK
jgi:hypothetical protein